MLCLPCFNSGRRKAKLQNLNEKAEDHFAQQLSPLFQTQEQSQQSQARTLNLQYLHHNNDTLLQNGVFLRLVASSINDASLFMLSEDVCPGLLLLDGVLGPVAVISTADLQAIENRRPASSSWAPLFFEISENIQARSEDVPQPLTQQQKSSFLMTLAADACSDEQLRVLLMCAAFSLLANKYFIHEHVLKPPSHHVGKALSSNGYLQSPKILIKTCVFGNVEKEEDADKTSAANPEMVPKYDGPSHHSKGPYYANASYARTISSTIPPAYTFLLEHVPALVTLLNSEGLIVYQNPASAQYYSGILGDVNVAPEHAQVDHLLDQWCEQSHTLPGASALSAAPLGVTALLRRGGILRKLLSVETSKETVSDLLGHIFRPPLTTDNRYITEWRGMLRVCGADAEQGGEQGASFSWNAVQPDGRDGGMEQAHESPSLSKGEEQGLESTEEQGLDSTESEVAPLAEVQGIGSVAHDSHNDDSHYGLSGTSADLGSVMRLGASSSLRSRVESFAVEGVRDLEPGSHMTDDPGLRVFRKVGRSIARSSTFSIRQVSQFSPEPFSPNMEGSGGEDQGSSWTYRQLGIRISSRGGLDLEEEEVSESFQALRASSALSSMKQSSSGASSSLRKGGSRLHKFHRTMQLLATAESSRMLKTAASSKARRVSSGRSRGSKQNSQEVLLSTFSAMAGHSYLISSPPSEENSIDQLEGALLKGPGRVRRVGYHRSVDNNLISKSEKLPSRQLRFERTSSVFDRSLCTNTGEDLNPLIMESLQMEEPMTAQDLEPRTHSSQVLTSLWPSNALPLQVDSSTPLDAARPSGSATEANEGMEVAAQYLPSFPPNRHTASGAMTVYRRKSDLLKKQQLNEQEGEKMSFSTMLSDKARSGGRTMQRAQGGAAGVEHVEEGMMGGDASQVQPQSFEGLHPAAPNSGKSGRVAPSSSFSSEPLLFLTQVSEDHLQHMPSANSQKGMPSLQDVKRERTVGVSEAVDSEGPGSVESWRKLQLALRQQKEQFDLQSPANVGGQHGAGNASKSDMREEDRDDKVGHDVGKADLQEGIASNQQGIPPQSAPGGEQLLLGAAAAGSSLVGDSWHDVVIRWVDSADTDSSSEATGESTHMLLIVQMDVTEQIQMQETLAAMSEGQLSLLSSIFPRHVVETLSLNDLSHLSSHFGSLAKLHKNVSILFLDIVGFTVMSNSVSPSAILVFLNRLFTMFDVLADKHNVQKVDTAGDCYIASAGITGSDEGGGFFHARSSDEREDDEQSTINYTLRMLDFAQDMLRNSKEVTMPHNGQPVSVRIGIHTGPCVSGLVGTKVPKFSVFGDTINTASRMESTCEPGCIQVSATTYQLLLAGGIQGEEWEALGPVEIKGKGKLETYLWRPQETSELPTLVPMTYFPVDTSRLAMDGRNHSLNPDQDGSGEISHGLMPTLTSAALDRVLEDFSSPSTGEHSSVSLLNPGLKLMIQTLHQRQGGLHVTAGALGGASSGGSAAFPNQAHHAGSSVVFPTLPSQAPYGSYKGFPSQAHIGSLGILPTLPSQAHIGSLGILPTLPSQAHIGSLGAFDNVSREHTPLLARLHRTRTTSSVAGFVHRGPSTSGFPNARSRSGSSSQKSTSAAITATTTAPQYTQQVGTYRNLPRATSVGSHTQQISSDGRRRGESPNTMPIQVSSSHRHLHTSK